MEAIHSDQRQLLPAITLRLPSRAGTKTSYDASRPLVPIEKPDFRGSRATLLGLYTANSPASER